ncbi:hypothetical protein [Oceanibium sediminis]|uniref:hypothetical protein n=1 Tax=Oceanibium sediminis TaxID=2026339 RepID=UPI000DD3036E|nr:hypothetical protein [Oceanibium sediminis]
MLDYRGFCYLDVEKTGSTFVRGFLTAHAHGEPLDDTKHRVPRWAFRRRKFYFASARDPFDAYASLYSFGCDGKGALRSHLWRSEAEILAAYDYTEAGFHHWLEAMLSPERRALLPPSTLPFQNPHIGLMGTRFLRQTLPLARWIIPRAKSAEELRRAYARLGLPRAVLRQEQLNADLAALVSGPLARFMRDPHAAAEALRTAADAGPAVNASDRSLVLDPGRMPSGLAQRLRDVEWFHYDVLGYPPVA